MEAAPATIAHHHQRPITHSSSKRHHLPQLLSSHFLKFSSSVTLPNPKHTTFILTHCSTKPNTNQQNPIEENYSTPEQIPTPNPGTQVPPKPTSNQSISSSTSFSRGLVFDLGLGNSWDSLEIGSPVVKRFLSDEEERWYMWYYGKSGENPDSVGLAVSSNGVHWERGEGNVKSNSDVGLVMECSKDWWSFDTRSVRPAEMVVMSSSKVRAGSAVYWLYYTGFGSEKIDSSSMSGSGELSFRCLPGLAMSQDGRYWARIEGEHHSGALLDVGSDGEWDSSYIASPQVVFHGNGDLRMYYHSFDVEKGHFAIGVARSRDGMRWVKLGKVLGGGVEGSFDECGVVNARVLRDKKDGKYLMVYEGVGKDGKRSVGMAVSSDGLKEWKRVQESPVLQASVDGGWDCEGVGMPCLVHMDGETDEWRLYYRGIGEGGRTGIGLAVSNGNELSSFHRWTGFHL